MIHIPTMVKEWEVSNYCDAMEGYHKILATCNFDLEFILAGGRVHLMISSCWVMLSQGGMDLKFSKVGT